MGGGLTGQLGLNFGPDLNGDRHGSLLSGHALTYPAGPHGVNRCGFQV
jgi:hypothetical protein